MLDQPVVYATVMKNELSTAIALIERHFAEDLQRTAHDLASSAVSEMQRAYAAGVVDGFQQGVRAECDRRARESLSAPTRTTGGTDA